MEFKVCLVVLFVVLVGESLSLNTQQGSGSGGLSDEPHSFVDHIVPVRYYPVQAYSAPPSPVYYNSYGVPLRSISDVAPPPCTCQSHARQAFSSPLIHSVIGRPAVIAQGVFPNRLTGLPQSVSPYGYGGHRQYRSDDMYYASSPLRSANPEAEQQMVYSSSAMTDAELEDLRNYYISR